MPNKLSNQPEVEDSEVQPEELIFNKEDVVYFPPGNHVWRQQGPYLVCKACELHHAVYIGMDKLMVGEEDGTPILRDRASI